MDAPPAWLVAAIDEGAAAPGQALPDGADVKLAQLLLLLERWTARINLTAVRGLADMVAAHVLDSLSIRRFIAGQRIADVGTGAGFPGLPLALVLPERAFELLDSHGRKLAFVRQAIAALAIANARAVQARAEAYRPERPYDTVCVRAFGSLEAIVAASGHLVAADGVLLAMKGRDPEAELRAFGHSAAAPAWQTEVLPLSVPGLGEGARHLVRLRRAR